MLEVSLPLPKINGLCKVVELAGEGSVIDWATPYSYFIFEIPPEIFCHNKS